MEGCATLATNAEERVNRSELFYGWRERIEDARSMMREGRWSDATEAASAALSRLAGEIFERYLDELLEERRKSERSDPKKWTSSPSQEAVMRQTQLEAQHLDADGLRELARWAAEKAASSKA